MTPLQAMLASISSIAVSVWFVFLIGRYSAHKRNAGRSYLSQEVSKISLGSYMFWTTIGLFATIYNRLITKPIKYLRTSRHAVGVGYVTPLEEAWFCMQLVFWYLAALVGYPFIRVFIKVRLWYYRNCHPVYSKMQYVYEALAYTHYWLPVDNGWIISDGEWIRDISIKPNKAFLMQSGNHLGGGMYHRFVIPYYTLGYNCVDRIKRDEKVIVIKFNQGDLHANDPKSYQTPV